MINGIPYGLDGRPGWPLNEPPAKSAASKQPLFDGPGLGISRPGRMTFNVPSYDHVLGLEIPDSVQPAAWECRQRTATQHANQLYARVIAERDQHLETEPPERAWVVAVDCTLEMAAGLLDIFAEGWLSVTPSADYRRRLSVYVTDLIADAERQAGITIEGVLIEKLTDLLRSLSTRTGWRESRAPRIKRLDEPPAPNETRLSEPQAQSLPTGFSRRAETDYGSRLETDHAPERMWLVV